MDPGVAVGSRREGGVYACMGVNSLYHAVSYVANSQVTTVYRIFAGILCAASTVVILLVLLLQRSVTF